MNLTTQTYLLLSHYLPLPLSALKIIEENPSHPFHKINELKKQEILDILIDINKRKNIIIRNPAEKANKAYDLVKNSISDKIISNLEKWKELGITIIPYFDDKFPLKLKTIKNPPKTIFTIGLSNFDYSKSISIIGTRKPTAYGAQMAETIGLEFTKRGFTIVNGFANGVDTLAMKGCLKAGGKVIGVLGSGLLNPYPKENVELFHEIINKGKGFFLSEHLPNDPVKKSTLATRNRISSALSIGNVFIEGSAKSGIRYQLKYAKEQNKPIVVLKPKEDNPNAAIPNQIITEEKNCYIIESIDDIPPITKKLIEINKKKENLKSNNKQKKLSDFK